MPAPEAPVWGNGPSPSQGCAHALCTRGGFTEEAAAKEALNVRTFPGRHPRCRNLLYKVREVRAQHWRLPEQPLPHVSSGAFLI